MMTRENEKEAMRDVFLALLDVKKSQMTPGEYKVFHRQYNKAVTTNRMQFTMLKEGTGWSIGKFIKVVAFACLTKKEIQEITSAVDVPKSLLYFVNFHYKLEYRLDEESIKRAIGMAITAMCSTNSKGYSTTDIVSLVGIESHVFYRYHRGEYFPTSEVLFKIAKYCGYTPKQFWSLFQELSKQS